MRKIAMRMREILEDSSEEVKKMELEYEKLDKKYNRILDEFRNLEFRGDTVFKQDRIGLKTESPKSGSYYLFGVGVQNPNRGAAYFEIKDEKDLDRIEKSFISALSDLKKEFKKMESERDKCLSGMAKLDRELKSKR